MHYVIYPCSLSDCLGLAFALVIMGKKRYKNKYGLHIIMQLGSDIDVAISSIQKECSTINSFTPLQEFVGLNHAEYDGVMSVIAKERKALHAIFESYVSRLDNELAQKELSAAASTLPLPAAPQVTSYHTKGKSSFKTSRGLSFENVVEFSKDFDISPGIISRSQLVHVFELSANNSTVLLPAGVNDSAVNGTIGSEKQIITFRSGILSYQQVNDEFI